MLWFGLMTIKTTMFNRINNIYDIFSMNPTNRSKFLAK